MLPAIWKCVPIVTVPKPNKDATTPRQISFMAGGLKLYDCMLHARVTHIVQKRCETWLFSGRYGADEATWTLAEFVSLRRAQYPKRATIVGFLDAECAYCRPPQPVIMVELWECDLGEDDWLAIDGLLESMHVLLVPRTSYNDDVAYAIGCPAGWCIVFEPFLSSAVPIV